MVAEQRRPLALQAPRPEHQPVSLARWQGQYREPQPEPQNQLVLPLGVPPARSFGRVQRPGQVQASSSCTRSKLTSLKALGLLQEKGISCAWVVSDGKKIVVECNLLA